MLQYRCGCRRGLHRQLGGCGCCGGDNRHQRSWGCGVAAFQRGCWCEFQRCGSWGRGSRGRGVWQRGVCLFTIIRWFQQGTACTSQAEGNNLNFSLALEILQICNNKNFFILTCCFSAAWRRGAGRGGGGGGDLDSSRPARQQGLPAVPAVFHGTPCGKQRYFRNGAGFSACWLESLTYEVW